MSIFKYTMFLEGFDFGWSESWYFEMPTDNLGAAQVKIGQVPQARAALLGTDTSVRGDRVALIRDAANQPVTNRADPRTFYFPGAANKPVVPLRTSLLVRYRTADQTHSKLCYLGGVPRENNPFDDTFKVADGSNWMTAFNDYNTKLIAAGLGWQVQGAKTEKAITAYVVDPDTGIVEFQVAANGMAFPVLGKPTPVRVAFAGKVTALDGVYDVDAAAQQTFKTIMPRPAASNLTGGVIRRFDKAYVYLAAQNPQGLPGTATISRFVGRQRGKGSIVSRGRRGAVVRF